jgi:hypothetical protein
MSFPYERQMKKQKQKFKKKHDTRILKVEENPKMGGEGHL